MFFLPDDSNLRCEYLPWIGVFSEAWRKKDLDQRMDRSLVQVGKAQQLEARDNLYWKNAPLEEKLVTINYLRESFYGSEATTGRLQRIFEFVKQE